MDLNDEPGELSAAAIARLAGVSRAAVTAWRNRSPDFPQPTGGTESRPTFDRAAVVAWLTVTGKASELATSGRTGTGTHLTEEEERLRLLREQELESSITNVTPAQLLARSMAALLPRTTAIGTSEPVHSDADGDGNGNGEDVDLPVVLDPACGEATLLIAVGDRFGSGVRLVGQDASAATASRAAHELRAAAHRVPYDIRIGDSLIEDRLDEYLGKAAAVVCDPPFAPAPWPWSELTHDQRWAFGTPGPRDGELAWVQHCYAYLRPRGVAVIAVSTTTCVSASGQAVRAALVRSGVLRDVVALPKGLGTTPDAESCLWVLRRSYGAPNYEPVRMVDLSRLGDITEAPYEYAAWQQLFRTADPGTVRMIPRLELLDSDANLLPSRYVVAPVSADADAFNEVIERLRTLYQDLGRCLPRFTAPASAHRPSYVTFAELERTGALSIRSRDTTPRKGDLLMRVLGLPPVVATGTAQDEANIAYVVEIDDTRLDAHFAAAFLRADANAQPVTNTLQMLSRDNLRRCRIPRMPITEQRRYGDAFRRLHHLEQTVSALATTSLHVLDQNARALITGVLDPDFAPPAERASTDEEKRHP